MVGAELCFKPVDCMSKWCRHDSRVCDNDIEGLSHRQQLLGTGPHTGEVPKIQFDQSETSTIGCGGVLSNLDGRSGFGQIPCSTHQLRAMRSKRARSLYTDPS